LSSTNEQTSVVVEKGKFVFDIRDFTRQYSISGTGFEIETLGQGMIFLEIQEDKVTLFSQSSTLKLILRDMS